MAKLPFVGPTYQLNSRPSGIARTFNMLPHPTEPGNERTAWVFKDAPGLIPFNEPSAESDTVTWNPDTAASAALIAPNVWVFTDSNYNAYIYWILS